LSLLVIEEADRTRFRGRLPEGSLFVAAPFMTVRSARRAAGA
jgi:hypothetical protein